MALDYVIWNAPPQLIDLGKFEIRYYSLLFALGFIMGYLILFRIFKKKDLQADLLDRLTVYMVVSTIIGARFGHCLFYEFDYYSRHPLEIILPWHGTLGSDFEFTGFQGLASHGAAIGILIGIYLFARKTKSSYLWTMDMIVLVTALAGCFIRLGNLMNSEIYGNPTKSNYGFVFTHDLTRLLSEKYKGTIQDISYEKAESDMIPDQQGVPLKINIRFARQVKDENGCIHVGVSFVEKQDFYRERLFEYLFVEVPAMQPVIVGQNSPLQDLSGVQAVLMQKLGSRDSKGLLEDTLQ